ARAGARLVLMVTLRGTGFSPVACNRSPCFSCNRELENQVALAQLRTGHDDPELVRRIRIGAAVQHPVVEAQLSGNTARVRCAADEGERLVARGPRVRVDAAQVDEIEAVEVVDPIPGRI